MSPSLRFLILEGNTRAVREGHSAETGRTPAQAYGEVLVAIAGGHFDILHAADADAALPAGVALADYDAAIITGSSLHVWQEEPEALRQVALAQAVFASGVPFFGSCWGLQVASVAAGGAVHRNPNGREVGFARRIAPNAEGRAHPLLAGRPEVFDAPCSHLDEVAVLPPDSTLLASNAVSRVQAAEIRHAGGTFWGVQYHPEYSLSQLAHLIERRMETLIAEGFFADARQKEAFIADLRALDADPGLRHAAWRYGLGPDVTDPALRTTELRNFIAAQVRPRAIRRAA
jgi:GMP synthase (glutamine-hydrolysing)